VESCYYCGLVADTVDHVVPQAYLRSLRAMNPTALGSINRTMRVPACRECNSTLGAKELTLLARRRFIAHRLLRKYKTVLQTPTWTERELAELSERMQWYVIEGLHLKTLVLARIKWARGGKAAKSQLSALGVTPASFRLHPGKSIAETLIDLQQDVRAVTQKMRCEWCEDWTPWKEGKRFCSPACKQASFRASQS